MGHSADGFGLAQITWASQIGLEARPAWAGSPRPKHGMKEAHRMAPPRWRALVE
jgi:hypothetical protein